MKKWWRDVLMSNEQQKNEQVVHITQKEKAINEMDVFYELKRRVDLTRRARIKASDRLREKHEFFENIIFLFCSGTNSIYLVY